MTTPQSHLYTLSDRITNLIDMFKPEENEDNIFDKVKQIELQQCDIITSQIRIENQLALIIKLLSKE